MPPDAPGSDIARDAVELPPVFGVNPTFIEIINKYVSVFGPITGLPPC